MSKRIQVALVNHSDHITDEELDHIVAALQAQVTDDFRPHWGIAAELHSIHHGQKPPADMSWLALLENSDQAGALGYHDLTPALLPVGKVFVAEDIRYGAKPSITCSHELLEMLGDRFINKTAFDPSTGRLWAYEASDAVEADELGYEKDGIRVSDFVLEEFFDPQHSGRGMPLSFQGHVTEPFQLAPGGYGSYLDLNNMQAGWQQEMDQEAAGRVEGRRAPGLPPGSRRERRVRRWQAEGLRVSDSALAEATV